MTASLPSPAYYDFELLRANIYINSSEGEPVRRIVVQWLDEELVISSTMHDVYVMYVYILRMLDYAFAAQNPTMGKITTTTTTLMIIARLSRTKSQTSWFSPYVRWRIMMPTRTVDSRYIIAKLNFIIHSSRSWVVATRCGRIHLSCETTACRKANIWLLFRVHVKLRKFSLFSQGLVEVVVMRQVAQCTFLHRTRGATQSVEQCANSFPLV